MVSYEGVIVVGSPDMHSFCFLYLKAVFECKIVEDKLVNRTHPIY